MNAGVTHSNAMRPRRRRGETRILYGLAAAAHARSEGRPYQPLKSQSKADRYRTTMAMCARVCYY